MSEPRFRNPYLVVDFTRDGRKEQKTGSEEDCRDLQVNWVASLNMVLGLPWGVGGTAGLL